MREDGRRNDELRKVRIQRNYIIHPEGSVLIEMGDTKVICNATVEDFVPPFLKGAGKGWLTCEYAMLPRATNKRNQRDIAKLKQNSRSVEISRLIGRSLRMAVDLTLIGERTIIIDCDVIQADGGTRCASITGGFVALHDAVSKLMASGVIRSNPIKHFISAVSAGIVGGEAMLDLCYTEDSGCEVDSNIVMTDTGEFVEFQGTGENAPFSPEKLSELIALGAKGNRELITIQKKTLE